MSPASKTDPLDLEWGAKKQYYRLEFDNPFNFPMLWLRYENMCPCIPSLRSAWAAFSPFGNKFAFSRQTAVTRLQELTASWSEEVYSSKSKFGYINILESKKSRWSSQLKRAAKSLLFKDVGNHFPRNLTDPLEHAVQSCDLEGASLQQRSGGGLAPLTLTPLTSALGSLPKGRHHSL